jgi:hypothetical protein
LADEMDRVSRRLQVVGWVMVVLAVPLIVFELFVGAPYLVVYYALLLTMGGGAVRVAALLRTATPEKAVRALGRGYFRQSCLVLAWIALGMAFALWRSFLAP